MKKNTILLLLLFFQAQLFSQAKTGKQIDIELSRAYKKIEACRFSADTIDWHCLDIENRLFRKKMTDYTSANPSTLTSPLDSLKTVINIADAGDHLFRIYSWDTDQGGTMHDFEAIFQYKSGDAVYSKAFYNDAADNDDYIPFYSKIFTLKANNKTYYLAISNGIYSNKDISQSVQVFTIEGNAINDKTKIIKTKSGLTHTIRIDFDFFSVVDRPERPLELIKYDADKKIIYIPIVLENGKVTNRFIRYQFTGQYFEKMITQKNTALQK